MYKKPIWRFLLAYSLACQLYFWGRLFLQNPWVGLFLIKKGRGCGCRRSLALCPDLFCICWLELHPSLNIVANAGVITSRQFARWPAWPRACVAVCLRGCSSLRGVVVERLRVSCSRAANAVPAYYSHLNKFRSFTSFQLNPALVPANRPVQ